MEPVSRFPAPLLFQCRPKRAQDGIGITLSRTGPMSLPQTRDPWDYTDPWDEDNLYHGGWGEDSDSQADDDEDDDGDGVPGKALGSVSTTCPQHDWNAKNSLVNTLSPECYLAKWARKKPAL